MKVSIIIPVYNLEIYIEDCINSVLEQSYSNFEAIFVNDGSSDNSANIIEKYTQIDPRIVLLNIDNGGVTNARYQGFMRSSGDYIIFLDGDDLLCKDTLSIFIDNFSEENIDIVVSSYTYISDKGIILSDNIYDNIYLNYEQYLEFIFSEGNQGTPWGRMFKSSIIEKIAFSSPREINVREDSIMNMLIALKAHKIKIISNITYKYRVRSGSAITLNKDISYFLDYYKYINKIIIENAIKNKKVLSKIDRYCFLICIDIIMLDIRNFKINNHIRTVIQLIEMNRLNWSFKEKIKIKLFKIICLYK